MHHVFLGVRSITRIVEKKTEIDGCGHHLGLALILLLSRMVEFHYSDYASQNSRSENFQHAEISGRTDYVCPNIQMFKGSF
jgi:hypothetical protein